MTYLHIDLSYNVTVTIMIYCDDNSISLAAIKFTAVESNGKHVMYSIAAAITKGLLVSVI